MLNFKFIFYLKSKISPSLTESAFAIFTKVRIFMDTTPFSILERCTSEISAFFPIHKNPSCFHSFSRKRTKSRGRPCVCRILSPALCLKFLGFLHLCVSNVFNTRTYITLYLVHLFFFIILPYICSVKMFFML